MENLEPLQTLGGGRHQDGIRCPVVPKAKTKILQSHSQICPWQPNTETFRTFFAQFQRLAASWFARTVFVRTAKPLVSSLACPVNDCQFSSLLHTLNCMLAISLKTKQSLDVTGSCTSPAEGAQKRLTALVSS